MADYGLSRRRRSTATEGGDLDAGISGGVHSGVVSPLARRWTSYAAIGSYTPLPGGSTGARFFFDCGLEDEPRHFLDACFLCNMPLGRNRDIYMYRGDIPFCSEECRLEQIEMDEAREKSRSLSMRASSSRKEQQVSKEKASSTGIEAQTAGAVVAV